VTAASGTEIFEFLGQAAFITPPGDSQKLAEAIRDVARLKLTTDRALQSQLSAQLSRSDGLKRFTEALEA
jgi:colanic acid biosynthesis glycosyl transferase WcaI